MKPIETFVFFDLETTDLRTKQHGEPSITELGLLAIKRRHLLKSNSQEPRVQYKLRLCFKPHKKMSKESIELTGLNEQLLQHEAEFNIDVFNTINSFISCLEKPVCLIAHNGYGFHYPILKYHFNQLQEKLPDDLKCADSLYAFHDLLESERLGNVRMRVPGESQEYLWQEKPYLALKRGRFYHPGSYPRDSYILKHIYERVVIGAPLETNRAENHCIMMMKIVLGRVERFVKWLSENHCSLSEVPIDLELQ